MSIRKQSRTSVLITLSVALSIGLLTALPSPPPARARTHAQRPRTHVQGPRTHVQRPPIPSPAAPTPHPPSRQVYPSPTLPHAHTTANVGEVPTNPLGPLGHPPDPTAEIPWSAGTGGVADIQAAFNHARATENAQLGTSIPMLTLPSQAEWDGKSDGEKALWLINRERVDRGIHPLHGVEANVTDVAQSYADYLLANDAFRHDADGRSPWERLHDNPAIGACHDFLSMSENLYAFMSGAPNIRLPIERSVYQALYTDSGCCWGHRHTVLWYPYDDNGGPEGQEGFLGVGRASGGPYRGWSYAEVIVMDVFDPCASWDYGAGAALGGVPNSLTFVYSIPDRRSLSASRRVTPENDGNQETLTWQTSTSGTWFTASPPEGTTPNSFWVTLSDVDTSAIATYTGTLTVTVVDPTGVEGSPHTIDLTLRVVDAAFTDLYLPLTVRNCAP